jgi:predicted dehydrogenase
MSKTLKIGVVGYDTSHAPAFAKIINDAGDAHHLPGAQIVGGVATFSPDLTASASRVEGFTKTLRDEYQIPLYDSVEALLPHVDAVLLESVDGRRHLSEATPIIKAGKPLFIDKPLADNYANAKSIIDLAKEYGCPLFSSSSLRYDANILTVLGDAALGAVQACDAFSPGSRDESNPGLFWYGIHGVEILYTFMGAGCRSVYCQHNDNFDVVIGTWEDGRVGTVRTLRSGAADYGVTVFGTGKVLQTTYSREVPMYSQLLKEVLPFLESGVAPIPVSETLEMMAFMQAALLSEKEARPVKLEEIG